MCALDYKLQGNKGCLVVSFLVLLCTTKDCINDFCKDNDDGNDDDDNDDDDDDYDDDDDEMIR